MGTDQSLSASWWQLRPLGNRGSKYIGDVGLGFTASAVIMGDSPLTAPTDPALKLEVYYSIDYD